MALPVRLRAHHRHQRPAVYRQGPHKDLSCGCLKGTRSGQNIVDLTGQRFGRLVAVARDGRLGVEVAWRCQCDCGNTVRVRSWSLRLKNPVLRVPDARHRAQRRDAPHEGHAALFRLGEHGGALPQPPPHQL
jgi:hypothetical protein